MLLAAISPSEIVSKDWSISQLPVYSNRSNDVVTVKGVAELTEAKFTKLQRREPRQQPCLVYKTFVPNHQSDVSRNDRTVVSYVQVIFEWLKENPSKLRAFVQKEPTQRISCKEAVYFQSDEPPSTNTILLTLLKAADQENGKFGSNFNKNDFSWNQ